MSEDQEIYDDSFQPELKEPKRNIALPIFIVLFLLSLALNVWMFFNYAKKARIIEEQNKEITLLYEQSNLRADSLQQELDFVNSQLQDKINELLAQEDLKENLKNDLESQKKKLNYAYARISRLIENGGVEGGVAPTGGPKTLAQAKQQINQLETANQEAIAKTQAAQKQYEVAQASANKFQNTAKVYRLENDSLIEVTDDLQDKLVEASVLRIQGLTITPQREKRGEMIPAVKASKVKDIKIDFSTVKSSLTTQDKKDLKIRIISPTGEVLSESTNSLTDISEVFTMEESINYNGSSKPITIYYSQDGKYKSGRYFLEIHHNDDLLDKTSFTLR